MTTTIPHTFIAQTTADLLIQHINDLPESAIIALVSKNGLLLEHIRADKLTKELVLCAVSNNSKAMNHIGALNDDVEFMLQLLAVYPNGDEKLLAFLKYASKELCKNRRFALACVRASGENIIYAKVMDEELVLIAVSNYAEALQFIVDEFKTYKVCLEACKYNYESLKYINESLFNNKEFITELINFDPEFITYLFGRFNRTPSLDLFTVDEDMKYIESILIKYTHLTRYLPQFHESKELMLKLIKIDASIIRFNKKMQDDKDFIIAMTVGNPSWLFRYVSPRLQKYKEVVHLSIIEANTYVDDVLCIDIILDRMGDVLKRDVSFILDLLKGGYISVEQCEKLLVIKTDKK